MITLNLHDNVNEVFNERVQRNNNSPLHNNLCNLFETIRSTMNQYSSKKFTFEMSLGRDKDGSLDIDSLYALLSMLDMDSAAIDKINVRYRDSHTEELDVAKLKNKSFELEHNFGGSQTSLSKDQLLNNAQDAIDKTRYQTSPSIREYFSSSYVSVDDEIDVDSGYLNRQKVEV